MEPEKYSLISSWFSKEKANILNNYLFLIISKAANLILCLGLIAILTRILAPFQYGILVLFIMISEWFAYSLFAWSDASLLKYGKEELIKKGSIQSTFSARILIFLATYIIFLTIIFLVIIICGIYFFILFRGEPELSRQISEILPPNTPIYISFRNTVETLKKIRELKFYRQFDSDIDFVRFLAGAERLEKLVVKKFWC